MPQKNKPFVINENLPRVTEILGIIKQDWHAFYETQAGKSIIDAKAYRGTAVHELINQYQTNNDCEIFKADVQTQALFSLWMDYFKDNVEKVIHSEKRVQSDKYGYRGTLDAVLKIRGRKDPVMCDYKTTAMISDTCGMQLSAYNQAGVEMGLYEKPLDRIVVQITPKGIIVSDQFPKHSECLRMFLYTRELFKFLKNK